MLQPLGVAALGRWGLAARLSATGCPPIDTYTLDFGLSGARPFDDAMGEYQRERDAHALPMYEFTCQLAAMEPPPPEVQQLFGVIAGNQMAMDGFVQMNAGTISPAQFFSPENVGAIMAAARPGAAPTITHG